MLNSRRSAPAHGPLLALETAGSSCSVAVARDGLIVAAECRPLRHGHAEALFPMIERVMAEARLHPAQLVAVAAATGPGGFTGIRVGLAAAHGIALATGARLIGITSFAAVAASVAPAGTGDAELLLVALDSRRADLYVQLFEPRPALRPAQTAALAAAPLDAACALLPDELAAYVARHAGDARLLVAGDAAAAAAACLGARDGLRVADASAPDARGVALAALRQPAGTAAGRPAQPLYLRPPDVTLPRDRPAGITAGR
jgi:tRNA threonylcarbamoyladenosine biosynthesis protein TsaB